MAERVIRKCRNPECRQFFGVTKATKLSRDKRTKCPMCGFANKLNLKQMKMLAL